MHRIEFDRLTKRYGDHTAVHDLSFSVESGEIFGFLGPNGAGKSTSLGVLMGVRAPTSGDVRIDGVSVLTPEIHDVRRRVGYVAEQPVLYDFLTGREFLHFVAELYGMDRTGAARADALLQRLDLVEGADALVRTYSMGMKKKLAIAAALVHDPHVLVLDEPTGALDAAAARTVKDLMIEAREAGKLVLFTTHVMELAERLVDRVAVLGGGRLAACGTLAELRALPGGSPAETLEDAFLRLTARDARQTAPA